MCSYTPWCLHSDKIAQRRVCQLVDGPCVQVQSSGCYSAEHAEFLWRCSHMCALPIPPSPAPCHLSCRGLQTSGEEAVIGGHVAWHVSSRNALDWWRRSVCCLRLSLGTLSVLAELGHSGHSGFCWQTQVLLCYYFLISYMRRWKKGNISSFPPPNLAKPLI